MMAEYSNIPGFEQLWNNDQASSHRRALPAAFILSAIGDWYDVLIGC